METTVFLVRHGVTDWHRAGRVLGQRDIELNDEGREQARAVAEALAGFGLAEVISSPLQRAVQSAEVIGEQFGIQVARDPRLSDFRLGPWEGMTYAELEAAPDYQQFLADPLSARVPGGEDMTQIRDRAVAAVDQATRDVPAGEALAIVTHAGIVRLILANYLGSSLGNFHRLRVAPGSVSVLSFRDDRDLPRVLAVDWLPSLTAIVRG